MLAASAEQLVRVGVAGLGFGLEVLVPAFQDVAGVQVSALYGRNEVKLREVTARTGIAGFADLGEFLSSGLDAVGVAVPPRHAEVVVAAALSEGLAVFCEKPLGCSHKVAHMLAVKAGHHPNAVDFEFGDVDVFRQVREAIEQGMIGKVRHCTINWFTDSWAYRGGGWSWKTAVSHGGGVLALFGTHLLYLVELFLGPIVEVSATIDTRAAAALVPKTGVVAADEAVLVTLRHRDGALSSLSICNAVPGVSSHRWTIVGENGTAVLDNAGRDPVAGFTLLIRRRGGEVLREFTEPARAEDGRIAAVRRVASRFVRAVRTGGRCRPDFCDGARVALLADAIRMSASSRSTIRLEA